jgi:hypothetical protein
VNLDLHLRFAQPQHPFGGPDQYIFGNLTICGSQIASGNDEPILCGLTDAQERLIHDVHTAVSQEIAHST